MKRTISASGVRGSIIIGSLVLAIGSFDRCAAQAPGGAVRTWTGAGGNAQWTDPANWNPAGTPGPLDKAVVPGDSGIIEAAAVRVHELVLQPSANGNAGDDTRLRGTPGIRVTAGAGGVHVGTGATIQGADGANSTATSDGRSGGGVTVTAQGPITVAAGGTIRGGNGGAGGDGKGAGTGGSVTLHGVALGNDGVVRGGNGGDKTGAPGGCEGRDGGSGGRAQATTTTPGGRRGDLKGGTGGNYSPNGGLHFGRRGRDGAVYSMGPVNFQPADRLRGSEVCVSSPAPINVNAPQSGVFTATAGSIRVDIHGQPLLIQGVAPGTPVFQAAEVCVAGIPMLPPGMTLAMLCGGAPVHVGANCAASRGTPILERSDFDDEVSAFAPAGWSVQTLSGFPGFRFDRPPAVSLPPVFGCNAAIADSNASAPAALSTTMTTPGLAAPPVAGPIVLSFLQWHRTCPGCASSCLVEVLVNNVAFPVYANSSGTVAGDPVTVDLTSFLAPASDFGVRFTYMGTGSSSWILDAIAVTGATADTVGQAPQPGRAILDIAGATNANGESVATNQPGPYFVDVTIDSPFTIGILGAPLQPIVMLGGFTLPGTTLFPGIGQLDLDPFSILVNGLDPAFGFSNTGLLGVLDLPVLAPPPLAGLTLGLQAAVIHPSTGVALSNAVEVRFGP